DAEQKISKAGKPYLRFRVRVGDGEGAQWLAVMSFDADAVAVAHKMVKGARVYVEGRLSLDEWTANDGTARHGLSVMSWHTRLAPIGRTKPSKPKTPPSSRSPALAPAEPGFHDDPLPF